MDKVSEAMFALYDALGTWRAVSDYLGDVSPATCWKVANGQLKSKRVNRKLKLTTGQIRLSASVTADERQALRAMARYRGMSWSQFCKALARGELEVR